MATTKQTKMLNEIGVLRERRLQLAELEVSHANAAVEAAAQKLSSADEALHRTGEFCIQEHRRLNEELSGGGALSKDGLYAWKKAHEKLQERLKTAQNHQADARTALNAEQNKLHKIKVKRRTEALAVERLKVMQEPDQQGS